MPPREVLPILLHVVGKLAVVVGGGGVGRRKAKAVLASGARVRVVCLEGRPPEEDDPGLDWVAESYTPTHLCGAILVFAAGPPELNARVVQDARALGVWVSSASAPESGDFSLPACTRLGDVVLAVGTNGAAPALAGNLCRWLAGHLDGQETGLSEWAALLGELRPMIFEQIPDPEARANLLRSLADWEWLEMFRVEGKVRVRQRMQARIREVAGLAAP